MNAIFNTIFNRTIPYNTNKHNYWALISFSFLSVILHLLPISESIHNMLYSANVFSLIGFTILIFIHPNAFYNYYGETIRDKAYQIGITRVIPINQYTINVFVWLAHFIPVFVLRNTYTLGNPMGLFLVYLLLFFPFLHKIYPFTIIELGIVFVISVILLLLWAKTNIRSVFI